MDPIIVLAASVSVLVVFLVAFASVVGAQLVAWFIRLEMTDDDRWFTRVCIGFAIVAALLMVMR